jgi:hypothetical protein
MYGSDAAVEIYAGFGGDIEASKEVRGFMEQIKISANGFASRVTVSYIAVAIFLAINPIAAPAKQQPAKSTPAAQQASVPDDPISALIRILSVACRQDTEKFPEYLTTSNATFYKQLAPAQQVAILRRLVLLDDPGRALLSTRDDGTTEIRCETKAVTRQIHLSKPRTDQNISFVPIDVKPDRRVDFGLLATKDGWKLLSIGVLMLDFAQLQPEWEAQDMADREEVATGALYKICAAIDTYRKAFDKLPDTLAQLGPASKDGISPDAAGLLKDDLITGAVEGYAIRYRVIPSGTGADTQFELVATPTEYGRSGKRSFFMNATGKLRGADKTGAPATVSDPLIDEPAKPDVP